MQVRHFFKLKVKVYPVKSLAPIVRAAEPLLTGVPAAMKRKRNPEKRVKATN